jgi:acetyltransferase-like isoleucine patch superfamily enzyme
VTVSPEIEEQVSTAVPTPAVGRESSGVRLFAVRTLTYLTNHVICHIPSFALRRFWYRRVLGIEFGGHAGVHLNCYLWFYGRGGIRRSGGRIGANSRINRRCTLDFRGGLRIGDNVSVSPEVMVLTIANLETSRAHGEKRPVVIEDNVWIGARAIVMPGVTLGRGSVVAAGAVVMRDVPPLAVVFGTPARPVGSRTQEEADYTLDGTFPLFE